MKRKSNRINRKFKLNTKSVILASVSAVFLATMMLGLNTEASRLPVSHIALKLDPTSVTLVSAVHKDIQILPGESKVDEIARLEREKAAAEAAAKAKSVKSSRQVVARESRDYSKFDSIDLTSVYKNAAAKYGITDWRILKAIHYLETGCATSGFHYNASGATGPMQFLPSTWANSGQDGDGDGIKDINNVVDAINGAAYYLAVCGGTTDIRTALYSYNRSTYYVNKVINLAESIAQ